MQLVTVLSTFRGKAYHYYFLKSKVATLIREREEKITQKKNEEDRELDRETGKQIN